MSIDALIAELESGLVSLSFASLDIKEYDSVEHMFDVLRELAYECGIKSSMIVRVIDDQCGNDNRLT